MGDSSLISVVRRPVLDARLDVLAYELEARGEDGEILDPRVAAARLAVDVLPELGLRFVAGDTDVVLPVPAGEVARIAELLAPEGRITIDVLHDGVGDQELVTAIETARAAGFGVALRSDAAAPLPEDLLVRVEVLRVQGRHGTPRELTAALQLARRLRVDAWSDDVRSHADFAFLRGIGFTGFAGDFYLQPATLRGRGVPAERLGAARTIASIAGAAGDFETLEQVIRADAGLSVKLLRWANSAAIGRRDPVSTVREALARLGSATVARWALMVGVAGLSGGTSRMVARVGAVRARTCELLLTPAGADTKDLAFTAGLFSVLDAAVDAPMLRVVEDLGLDDRLAGALLAGTGRIGAVLRAVLAHEEGFPHTEEPAVVGSAHMRASAWVDELPWATMA